MADLPRIFARPELPFEGLPRVPENPMWGQLARSTGALAETFNRIEDASVEAESRRVIAETQAQIHDTIAQGEATESDPEAFHSKTTGNVLNVYRTRLEGIKNLRVKDRFENEMSPYLIKAKTTVDLEHQKKKVLNAQGNSVVFLDGAAQRMSRIDDPLELVKEEQRVVEHIDAMIKTGSMTPAQGVTAVIKVRDDATKEKVSWLTLTNPQKLIDLIRDPTQFPTLKGSERVAQEQRALEAIRERRVADQRAQQEIVNKQKDGYFVESQKDGANLAAIRQQALNDKTLDGPAREHIVNALNHSLNAKNKGELDPFTHTDGNVYKDVMTGILTEPDKWSDGRINDLVGKGLSIAHANQLREELGKSGGGKDIKKVVTETMDRYRSKFYFIDADKRPKTRGAMPKMEDVLQNDRVAQGILDEVWRRANNPQKPEDPRVVMSELMSPYYDKEIKGFWGHVLDFVPTVAIPPFMRPSDAKPEETTAARQILLRNKVEPTPEAINKVIERKRAGVAPPPVAGSLAGAKVGGMGPKPGANSEIPYLDATKSYFQERFKRSLPVSAEGQSATHDQLKFDHAHAFDVALSPISREGQELMSFLDQNKIPFLAFDRAIPGVATGPHIHVGKPSPRLIGKPEY